MRKRLAYKTFVYFLCASLLLLMSGLHETMAGARGADLPIGEILSIGDVMFEANGRIWRNVESSHFPVFAGTKIKTQKGIATVTLSNNSQIQVAPDSVLSFEPGDGVFLSKGSIEFRIPASSEGSFKTDNLLITRSRALEAAKGSPVSSPSREEIIGAASVHSDGSVTVESIRGKISVLNQERVLLAAISSRESVTLPVTEQMVAQVGEVTTTAAGAGAGTGGFLGLSTGAWMWVGIGVLALGGAGAAVAAAGGGDSDSTPVCP